MRQQVNETGLVFFGILELCDDILTFYSVFITFARNEIMSCFPAKKN